MWNSAMGRTNSGFSIVGESFTGLAIAIDRIKPGMLSSFLTPSKVTFQVLLPSSLQVVDPEVHTWVFYDWVVDSPVDGSVPWVLRSRNSSHLLQLVPGQQASVVEVDATAGGMAHGARIAGFDVAAVITSSHVSARFLTRNGLGPVFQGCIDQTSLLAQVHSSVQVGRLGIMASYAALDLGQSLTSTERILSLGMLWQANFMLLEFSNRFGASGELQVLLKGFCASASFQISTSLVDLSSCWPLKRDTMLVLLHPREALPVRLGEFPSLPSFATLSKLFPEWPVCSPEEVKTLLLSRVEVDTLVSCQIAPAECLLDMNAPCPKLCSGELSGSAHFSKPNLPPLVRVPESSESFRHLSCREASLLLTFSLDFEFERCRKQLPLVACSAPPLLVAWALTRYVEALYSPGAPVLPGSADDLLLNLLRGLAAQARDYLPVPSIAKPFCIQLSSDGVSSTVGIAPLAKACDLLAAERRLAGWGSRVALFIEGRAVPGDAFLRPAAYVLSNSCKVSIRELSGEPACVSIDCLGSVVEQQVARGTFLFEVALQLGAPFPVRFCTVGSSMPLPHDFRIFNDQSLVIQAAGLRTAKCNEGMDDVELSKLAHALPQLQLALEDKTFRFLEPRFLSRLFLGHPELAYRKLQGILTSGVHTVVGFFAFKGHWAMIAYVSGKQVPALYLDGVPGFLLKEASWLLGVVHACIGVGEYEVQQLSVVQQSGGVHCGPVALANLRWFLEPHFSIEEEILASANFASHLSADFVAGGAADQSAVHAWLENLLLTKGVPAEKASERATMALRKLGLSSISKCRADSNPWRSLKALADQGERHFQWVQYDELQQHIANRARADKGAVGEAMAKKKKQQDASQLERALALSPDKLALPEGSFVDTARQPLPQLQLDDICSTARGVIVATPEQAARFLRDSKAVSVDALAILTTVELPSHVSSSLPVSSLRWPAIYTGTQEPVLVQGSLVQLGDEAVAKAVAERRELKSVSTDLLRLQVYRDQFPGDWTSFAKGPVKTIVNHFPCFQKCSTPNCGVACLKFHPAVDEEVDSVLLDVFGWKWYKADGKPSKPLEAASFSVLVRVPATGRKAVVDTSATDGLYCELRSDRGKGPHPDFAIVWLPRDTLEEALHRKRTIANVQQVTRLQGRYGLRVRVSDEASLREQIFPGRTFVSCRASEIFQVGPFPHGATKQAVQDFLVLVDWKARPLRPVRGEHGGRFWEVGAEVEPPALILHAGDQDLAVTKVRSSTTVSAEQARVIASAQTKRHLMQADSDPWDISDPWKGYLGSKPGQATHSSGLTSGSAGSAESKLTEIEQRLKADLTKAVREQFHELQQDADMAEAQTEAVSEAKVAQLEVDVRELKAQTHKFEQWFKNAGDQVTGLQQQVTVPSSQVQEQSNQVTSLSSQLHEQSQASDSLRQLVGGLQASVRDEVSNALAAQTERLEALFSKQRRLQ